MVVATSVTGTQLGAFERRVVYRDSASERLAGSLRFTGPVSIQDLTFGGVYILALILLKPYTILGYTVKSCSILALDNADVLFWL